jgi:uncharacterized membrane protein
MPRGDKSSVELCLAFLIAGGLIALFMSPMIALVVFVCAVPFGIMWLYRQRTSKTIEGDTAPRASFAASASQEQLEEMQPSAEEMSTAASKAEGDTRRPDISARPSPSQSAPATQPEKGRDSVESLQARINELEERVRWLRERLAAGPAIDAATAAQAAPNGRSLQTSTGEGAEELSERALQQLLEALDEKLAKGTISQQLYQRLRDKYLARLSKARGKREAAPEAVSSKPRRRR